jgi:uncharacterized repeat protein (TIGR02543 family)
MATTTITNRNWDFYQGVNDNVYFSGSGNNISFGNGTSYNENMSKNKVLIYLSNMSGYSSITLNYSGCSMSGLTGLYFGLYWDPIGGDYFYTYDEIVEKSLSTGSGSVTLTIPSDVSDGYLGFAFHENSTNSENCANYASLTITSITAEYEEEIEEEIPEEIVEWVWLGYDANGGRGAPSEIWFEPPSWLTITSTIPTRFGYRFMGWSKSPSATSASYVAGDSIYLSNYTTLYAVWESPATIPSSVTNSSYSANIYSRDGYKFYSFTPSYNSKYRFESNGSLDTRVFVYNTSGTELASNDDGGENRNFKLDYDFIKDTTYYIKVNLYGSDEVIEEEVEEVVEEVVEEEVEEVVEVIIDFTVKRLYAVTYNANGGSGAPSTKYKVHDEDFTLSTVAPTKSDTYETCTVTLDANGGFCSSPSLTTDKMTSYDFGSWNTNPNSGGTDYYPGESYTNNAPLTLYASYIGAITVNPVLLPTPTRDGYKFLGWATSSTASSGETSFYYPEDDVTLYAIWTIKTYEVTYNANGGSGAPSSQTKTHGTDLTLSSTVPTRFGYTFLGWNTSSSATLATYEPSDSFTTDATTTLYAVWQPAEIIPSDVTNSNYSADISFGGVSKYYEFTPSTSGRYRFESSGSLDPKVFVYEANETLLDHNDNSGDGYNFRLDYDFTSGIKYYVRVKFNSNSKTGTINFTVKRMGLAYIYDHTGEFCPYQIFIYDGSGWNQYIPYIYNGSSWDICS